MNADESCRLGDIIGAADNSEWLSLSFECSGALIEVVSAYLPTSSTLSRLRKLVLIDCQFEQEVEFSKFLRQHRLTLRVFRLHIRHAVGGGIGPDVLQSLAVRKLHTLAQSIAASGVQLEELRLDPFCLGQQIYHSRIKVNIQKYLEYGGAHPDKPWTSPCERDWIQYDSVAAIEACVGVVIHDKIIQTRLYLM